MKEESKLNPNEHIKKFGKLIKGFKFAMVSTLDEGQNLHSCPLTTQQVDFDGDLWFIVGKNSEVYTNILADSHANVSYSSEKFNFVSASGTASVFENRELLKKFWNPYLEIWFKKGIDDPNIALIKINVEKAEYWESPSFAVTRIAAFAKAMVTGDKSALGEHHKITLN